MKKSRIITLTLILLAVLLLVPVLLDHIWAHDSSAKLIYDGRISQQIEFFHGSSGRKLAFINEPLLYSTAFIYLPLVAESGQPARAAMWMACPRKGILFMKVTAFSMHRLTSPDGCEVAGAASTISPTSMDFTYHGKPIHVSWLGYTEPPR